MRLLFWNTHRNEKINKYIAGIALFYQIDVIVLAEYTADKNELMTILGSEGKSYTWCNTIGCERVNICTVYEDIEPGVQDKYYSIQIIKNHFILVGTHLMSDLYGNHEDNRLERIRLAMKDIHDAETSIGSSRTIIMGDMNESPYDKGCLSAHGFHGLPELLENDNKSRIVDDIEYQKYYNPMWNLFGDKSYPPGTYYRSSSELYTPMWYMLDQIIIGADLLQSFNLEEFRIITSYGNVSLVDKGRHPDKTISDHFPVMCEVIEENSRR